jgi:HPt (histidine-containing phosphotransfer) domain-containing protein
LLEDFQLIALVDKVRGALSAGDVIEVGGGHFDSAPSIAFERIFGRDEAIRVATEFVANADISMASLRGYWKDGAIEQLACLAHELKVGADNFGLARLAEAGVQFEDAVVESQLDEVPRRLAALEEVYPAARAALDDYFGGLAG